jgi:uncharacterized membrane protein
LDITVLVLHVTANVVWVGALLAALVLVGMAAEDAQARGRMALRVYRTLAVPGFVGSLVFGVARLGLDWRHYLVTTHYMHVKLVLVVFAIILHHFVGARVRRMARDGQPVGAPGWTALAFGAMAVGSIIMAVAEPF